MRESNYTFSEGFYGMPNEERYSEGHRQIDWHQLKELIESKKSEHNGLYEVEVGLQKDWGYTCGTVWFDGDYSKASAGYTSSDWATPAAIFTYNDGFEEEIECWKLGSDPFGFFE